VQSRIEPKPLYSMRRLERAFRINRTRLLGRVEALGIPTYAGPYGAIAIDGDGLRRLAESLGQRIEAVPA
jgi:hypothetical protein